VNVEKNMSKHTLTAASDISYGDAYYAPGYSRRGVPITPIYKQTFSSAIAALDTNALATKQALTVAAATWAFASAVVGLTTDASSQRVLDHARNVTITTSDLAATATVIIKGEDVYGASMWERMLVTASDATVSGTKAFKKISKIIPSGATGVAYVGFGNRLGLDYKVSSLHDIIKGQEGDQGTAATDITVAAFRLPTYSATEVHSATSEGTASVLKDVRGTWKPLAVAPDGTVEHSLWYKISGVRSKFGAYGIDQTAS
jgi:hypothetical protein